LRCRLPRTGPARAVCLTGLQSGCRKTERSAAGPPGPAGQRPGRLSTALFRL